MFKRNWPFILAAAIISGIAGYFYYLYTQSPTLNWTPNYNHTSSSPYGNELLYKVMEDLYSEKDFFTIEEPLVYNRRFNNTDGNNNIYLFSGNDFLPDRGTISSLCNFINKGNQVFISASQISKHFLDSLLKPGYNSLNSTGNGLPDIQCMYFKPNLIHPDLRIKQKPVIRFKVFRASLPFMAGYIPNDFFSGDLVECDYYKIGNFEIANDESYTNYIKIKVGKGWLHLYTTPLVFTNYYLRKKAVFEYAQNVILHLEPGDIYWHVNSYASMGDAGVQTIEKRQNPFGVLLSFNSFRYAWYCFCTAIILFCIFGFKRKQRAIPVIEKNSNSSIEFAQTIAQLYLVDGKHKNMANQKFRYFFNFVRNTYGINIKDNLRADKQRLSLLSKLPVEAIDHIMFNYVKMESLPDTTADELKETVTLINNFYKISG